MPNERLDARSFAGKINWWAGGTMIESHGRFVPERP